RELLEAAVALEKAGAAMLLLECVPRALSAEITAAVNIPVTGIGAAPECDGQVLVMHDMLGLNASPARFVKDFMAEAGGDVAAAFRAYDRAVKDGQFPAEQHCF
ncbi:MAG TPA: 3-methyl-2-oxobutanoate hydroxymethyltransferase, partial [Alcanivorax sp.]|nr:3-methyl-2-oxobutanoate hydroxymethyltransferase [Alcanivorax sp.]